MTRPAHSAGSPQAVAVVRGYIREERARREHRAAARLAAQWNPKSKAQKKHAHAVARHTIRTSYGAVELP